MEADQDRDGKISFDEFTKMVENTDVSMSMTLGKAFLDLVTSTCPAFIRPSAVVQQEKTKRRITDDPIDQF